MLTDKILDYINSHSNEAFNLLIDLAQIPAPSHHEEKRAEFCKHWLETQGAKGVYIDDALNVIYPIGCTENNPINVFMAHSDVVFPDTSPLPLTVENGRICCPGVGDDTANVVALLMAAKYITETGLVPKDKGILLVVNSCEEGLGNLKGTRQLMKDFKGRVKEFYTFDSSIKAYANKCVGSHRYEITFKTEGGHSYGAFGNRSAVYAMADLICKLHSCEVPKEEGSKTTFNIGLVEGGTSVNTIPQSAKMLYEYRSDSANCLAYMKNFFEEQVEKFKASGMAEIDIKVVGERPCMGEIDKEHHERMGNHVAEICEKYSGEPCLPRSSSTDCNIPMSMGIPALAVGNRIGFGGHTREEKLLISSIPIGLKITAELILENF